MAWTNLFEPIAPYLHTQLSLSMGPWDIPAGTKNLRLSVEIGEAETHETASGNVVVQLSSDGGQTWIDATTYNWSWANVAGRGGIVRRVMQSSISIPSEFANGKIKGVSTLDALYIAGFRLEYET